MIDFAGDVQVFERHLDQNHQVLTGNLRVLNHLGLGPMEHVGRDPGNRPERTTFDQDAFLVERIGGLNQFA